MLEILYEDQYLVAINKAPGLLVHPSWITSRSTPNLMSLLKRQLGANKLHTVHRLDRATSGVILVGKTLVASQQLQQSFASREVQKTYLCLVRGWIEGEQTINYPLVPKKDKYAEPFAEENPEPKDAVTKIRALGQVELDIPIGPYPRARYSLVEAKPLTGRKHQIRRHMKHLLHPIIGDTKYGEGRHNRLFREEFDCHRMLLMAIELRVSHPITGESLVISAPVTQEVDQLFMRLGWSGLYPGSFCTSGNCE